MSDMRSCTIELKPPMVEFLEEVVKKHNLPDVGKAVRCLVNYARENPDKLADIFDEIRCADC